MDFNPALPRRSRDTLAAGGCRRRIAGVRRPRGVHRDRTAVPRIDRGGRHDRTVPGERRPRPRHIPRDRLPGALRDHRPRRLGDFDGASLGKYDPNDPDGWHASFLYFHPRYVPTDACAWQGALVQIDPTAEAFVDAMTAQTSTVSTPAVEVMVGDYSGFEFDHSVESDVDIDRLRRRPDLHLLGFGAGLRRTLRTQLCASAKPTEWST